MSVPFYVLYAFDTSTQSQIKTTINMTQNKYMHIYILLVLCIHVHIQEKFAAFVPRYRPENAISPLMFIFFSLFLCMDY